VARFQVLSPAEFETALAAEPRPFVLDVRSAAEFEAGRVPGARNIHVHEIASRRDELPTRKVVRILLVGEPGKRLDAAAAWFALMGYADVAVLDGGFAAWTGPVEKGPPPPPKPRGPELRIV
jgi:rhodanese-related sulfurtransferase